MIKKSILLLLFLCIINAAHAAGELSLRTVLDNQINNTVINVPLGTYVLDLTNNKWAYLFNGKKNVTIEGNGSTIICNRQSQAFGFNNCENVTFSNFYIEYDPPCSTQGTITAMSVDKRTWDVQIHDGYPVDNLGGGRIQAYGKNTLELVQNFGTSSSDNLIKTGTRTIRFTINGWANNPVQVGDYVALDVLAVGGTQAHTIITYACKNMKFQNIVVYDSNCFSFLEYDSENTYYYRCKVTRKLHDPKYPIDRLRAGIADALHSKYAKIGPTIEECVLEHSGDDCIAINGNFYPVYQSNETEKSISFLSTTSNVSDVRIKVGDKLVCVNNDGSIRGNAIVTSIIQSGKVTETQRVGAFSKLTSVREATTFTNGFKAVLDNWVAGSTVCDVVYSNDRIGSGFKVINNQVGHNRSRAILIKASDGLIDGNRIVGSAMSGIAIAPEFYWMEGGCPSNIIIRNNYIENCMFESNMSGSSQFAALVVVSQAPNGQFSPAGGLNNISIYKNTIVNCPQPCIGITSTKGLRLYDNIITPSSWIRAHGVNMGVSNSKPVFMNNVVGVTNQPDINGIKVLSSTELKLFINAGGKLQMKGMGAKDEAQIAIYDVMGKKMLDQRVILPNEIQITNLKDGIYLARIFYRGESYSSKIIL